MRKTMLVACAAMTPLLAQAELLWGKAEYGATVASIGQLYPDAVAVEPNEKERMDSGALLRYRISEIEIIGKPFSVSFYFIGDRLANVNLAHKSTESPHVCELTAVNLQEALRAKYGRDIANTRSGGLGVIRKASWASGKTTVSMSMFAFDTPSCHLYVGYGQRLAEAADKL